MLFFGPNKVNTLGLNVTLGKVKHKASLIKLLQLSVPPHCMGIHTVAGFKV
jgi:hypothetical protein